MLQYSDYLFQKTRVLIMQLAVWLKMAIHFLIHLQDEKENTNTRRNACRSRKFDVVFIVFSKRFF